MLTSKSNANYTFEILNIEYFNLIRGIAGTAQVYENA